MLIRFARLSAVALAICATHPTAAAAQTRPETIRGRDMTDSAGRFAMAQLKVTQ